MRILILGASGFLGSKIYSKLDRESSWTICGTCYKSKENNRLIPIDVINNKGLEELILSFQPDVVIWCLMDNEDEKRLISEGLANLKKYLSNETKLIYISTDAFADGKGNYEEDCEMKYLNTINPLAYYANAKIDGEKIVSSMENYTIIRTGPLYGRSINGKWDTRISTLIDKLKNGQEIKRTTNLYKTFMNVDDLADAVIELCNLSYKGILHVGPDEKESYYTFNKKIARMLGLNESLVIEDYLDEKESEQRGVPLDTSMNTSLCSKVLTTSFRKIEGGNEIERI